MLVSRKNQHNRNSRGMLYDILGKIGNYTCKIVTKEDNVRSEALRALNKWNGINTNNIDSYLDDIVALHVVTNKIQENLLHVRHSTDDMLPYIESRYSKINEVIDCYNSFLDSNPLVRIKYNELSHVDLTGVVVI